MLATVCGTEIYFDVDGAGLGLVDGRLRAKPTLVALHGGPGFDHAYLKPGLGPLRDEAQIVYVDLRGQGRSGRPPLETCSLEQMADDVAALCGVLGIERPVIFGHSAGGFVALHLALRHPALLGGLILCETAPALGPVGDDDDGEPAPSLASRAGPEVLEVVARVFNGDMTAASLAQYMAVVGPFYAGPAHMAVAAPVLGLTGISIDVMKHFFTALAASYDLRAALKGIQAPTLVMAGGQDWVCPPRASRLMARSIPGARLVEFSESGHLMFSEEPERFQAAVIDFLEALPSP
jgi:proline iminopeptidase